MKKITNVTKREIFDLFRYGLDIGFIDERVHYTYHGRLSEIEFLKKLYPLEKMESQDSRFKNFEGEIIQHRINNDDYEDNWIFEDERFELLNGDDEVLLRFLTEVFHPENRVEASNWKDFLDKISELLSADGYEMYKSDEISKRAVYSWRLLSKIEISKGKFVPFSQRHAGAIRDKSIKFSLAKPIRRKLLALITKYNEDTYKTTDTGLNYDVETKKEILADLREFYTPRAYDANGKFIESDNVDDFILGTTPYCVFDAIEVFSKYNPDNGFQNSVNEILSSDSLFKLVDGKMILIGRCVKIKEKVKEVGLKELLEQAQQFYSQSNTISDKQLALEKLWDAFERLKTYYKNKDKKNSLADIIRNISGGDPQYYTLFDSEFKALSDIGNNYRIRHHETYIKEISDPNHCDYLFNRCFALIDLALKYLK